MFKHLPILSALAPVAGGLWVIHPSPSTTFIAAGCIGAAAVESAIRKQVANHQERKAEKAEAKAERKAARMAARGHGPAALPPATPAPISYTAAADPQRLRRIG